MFTGELIVKQRRFWATQVDRKWTCFILGQVSSFQVDSLLARTCMAITHYTYVRLHHWLKLVEGTVENLPRQCFQSLLLDTRLVIANSFPSGTNGILILKYIGQTLSSFIGRIHSDTISSLQSKNMPTKGVLINLRYELWLSDGCDGNYRLKHLFKKTRKSSRLQH